MFKYASAIVIAALPFVAVAHEIAAGDKIVSDCWDTQPDHVSVSNCAYDAAEAAKTALNIEYKKLKTRGHDDGLEESIGASQEAFLHYMDKECSGRVRAEYGAGNGAGEAMAACEITLIDQRIQRINSSFLKHDQ